MRSKLKLSPLSRLFFTLGHELSIDNRRLIDDARYERYLKMQQVSEMKRDSMLRAVLLLDALAMLLLFGKSFSVPGLGMPLSEIPAARELLTFFASLSFQFFALAFINWHGYTAIVDAIGTYKAQPSGVDPDFVTASDKYMEFMPKLFRSKMNIYGIDFVTPGRGYTLAAGIASFLAMLSVYSILIIHISAVFVSALTTYRVAQTWFLYPYFLFLVTSNFGGVLLLFVLYKNFEFHIDHKELDSSRFPQPPQANDPSASTPATSLSIHASKKS
jgi:hypothetical protein